ncbi:hypothetical protein HYT02_02035 [Candidatus Gottesmanbacteria bacterium]|nr:hypothetical protein [Candidatus Gottesmanbacteria bacterium]
MNLPENLQSPLPEIKPISQLIEDVVQRHSVQETFVYEGKHFGYFTIHACADVLSSEVERGVSIDQLFSNLTSQTSITPLDINKRYDLSSIEVSTWEEFKMTMNEFILDMEVDIKYPRLVIEDNRRMDKWDPKALGY